MGETTKISWTQHTFNPWIGCTKVSPGCDNCYASTQDARWGHDSWGKGKPRRRTTYQNWLQPIKWDKQAAAEGKQHLVFCASLADVMDDEAPLRARDELCELIDATPHLTWQLLTKRPHRYSRYLPPSFKHDNVWLGTSAENQEFYNVRWPLLMAEARKRNLVSFISYEPALGPLSMFAWSTSAHNPEFVIDDTFPNWLIAGGESGAHRRPMETEWFESLKAECESWGVSFFVKQLSARTPEEGAKLIPASLLIRQFPKENKNDAAPKDNPSLF